MSLGRAAILNNSHMSPVTNDSSRHYSLNSILLVFHASTRTDSATVPVVQRKDTVRVFLAWTERLLYDVPMHSIAGFRTLALFLLGSLGSIAALASSTFPLNQAVNVRWQPPGTISSLFPYGSETITGTVVASSPGVRSGTFYSGIFGLQYQYNGQYNSFAAVCIDANENLFSSGTQLYYVESLANYPSFGPFTDAPAPYLTAERRKLLGQLFTVAWRDANNSSINSSAFQWATWEIGRETRTKSGGALDLSLGNGAISIASGTDSTEVRNKANYYLSLITATTHVSSLQIWSPVKLLSDGTYQRIAGQELLTLPEPAHYMALSAAVLMLLIYRRRRQARAAMNFSSE